MHYLIDKLTLKHTLDFNESNIKKDLKIEVEKAKHLLTLENQIVDITIEIFINGLSFKETLSRNELEELCHELFQDMFKLIGTTLHESVIKNSDVDFVVLVGNITKIPKIKSMLKDIFDD